MKPAPFDYVRAVTLDEVLDLIGDPDTKVLAGGQSLVPLLSLRLASPARLVDINDIPGLAFIVHEDGLLRIGALTRASTIEVDPLIAEHCPLLAEAVRFVAHPQIRNRGTIGGTVSHGDAAAEVPNALLALNASIVARSVRGTRKVPVRELYLSFFTTSLDDDELITEIVVPVDNARSGWGFSEFARRTGDYAIGGAACHLELDEMGRCSSLRLALLSAGPTPVLATAAAAALVGHEPTETVIAAAVEEARRHINAPENVHGTSAYREAVVLEMARRAVTDAVERARKKAT